MTPDYNRTIFEIQKLKKTTTMKKATTFQKSCIAIILFFGIALNSVFAQTPLFTQNFNSSSTLSNYINSSSPNNGQFNAITTSSGMTASITGSALQFVRTSGTGSFSRTTNFSPIPSGIIYKFDLNVTASSQTGTVARWQVGDGFGTNNSNESSNDCYAQFAIDFRSGNNYRINDISNGNTSSNFSGGTVRTITWVLNNSGNTLSYNAPDGTVKTVSNNRTDLWVGNTRVITGADVEDNGNISDLKFVFSNGTGTVIMDNILITQYIPIVTTQPSTSPSVCAGTSVTFTAAASGLPTPTVKWQKNISSVWTDISGATSNSYTISSPVVGDAGQYRALYTNSEGSTPSNTSTLTVTAIPTGGSVNSSATVCSGSNSGTLTLSGNTGTVQKWQSSTNGGSNWNDISNTSSSQNYTNLSTTTMYRAVVQSSGCTANSASATITINPTTSITTQPTNSSVCQNSNSSFTVAANGVGLSYKWQDNSSGSFADISGATSATLNLTSVGVAMSGRQYKCIVSGTCGSATSNTVTLTVSPTSVGGNVTTSATVCSGTNSGVLTLSGHTGSVQKWQSSTNGGSNWNDISNTTTSHSYTNLSTTTMYRAVVASGGCASANSTAATITVNALPTAYTVTGGGSYCTGGTGVSVGLSNSQSGINYQLKLAGINTGSAVAGTGSAISFGNNTAAGNYTVEATNASTSCVRTMTGSVNISINPLPSVSLAASSVDCFNSLLTATNSGGGMSSVTGTNGTDFSISSSGTPTISSTITLPAGYLTAASNLTVTLNIDHAGAGDLIATLISPSCGQTVLFNRPGGAGNTNDLVDNADYVFATSFGTTFPGSSGGEVPNGNYNASFSGLTYPCSNVAGTWTLQIQDMQNSRGGTLRSWSIAISNAAGYTTVFSGPATIGTTLNIGALATATVTPPNGTNSYTAITTDANGCVSAPSNSVNVVIAPTFSLTSLPSSQVSCVGQTATFDVVASGSGLSYQWRKGLSNLSNGGNIAGANSSTLTLANLAAVDAANNYNVVVTDGSCTLTSPNVSLGVGTTLPATPVVTPTSAVLFPGDIQALTATNTTSSTLGTGTSTNTTTGYPAVLGTYYGGARHQVLVLASELTTMGILAGEAINSISFDVANTNNAHPMTNYTINIGNTALSALNATFVGGLSQVYYTASYTANNGLNLINFSSPFVWNGTSNIVIETVFNNNYLGTTTNPNCSIKYTTTAFTSVNYSREDNVGAGNGPILALSSDGTSNRRPNMVFGHVVPSSITWSPMVDLYTDAAATVAYTGGNANMLYASPSSTTTYSAIATSSLGCPSASSSSAALTVITTPPNCVTATVNGAACVTATSLSWPAASNYPSGYYVYVGTDNPPTNMIYQQDIGLATSYNLPSLQGATTYYYQIAPYNANGENTLCAAGSFVSGTSATSQVTQVTAYTISLENAVVPALPCGVISSDENFPNDATSWYTSTVAPRSGGKHLSIDKNPNNVTAKDDWVYSAPLALTAGKLYRIYWYSRVSSAAHTENYEVFMSNSPDAATMLTTSSIFTGATNLLSYQLDSSADIIPPFTGEYYFAIHANSPANRGSLYLDDISVIEIPVTALSPLSCTTIPSMSDQLFCNTILGAQDYKYKIENLSTSFSYEYTRNFAIPDFRLIWAPGVLYGNSYDVSVSYKKNNVWSPYGAACPVTIGPFPIIQLRPSSCGISITDQSVQLFTDSVPGANDYEYRIVNSTLGYDHTWSRGNTSTNYRLSWAYQYSPILVESLPYGYTYDVQVRALVGKTGAAYGNLPGEYGSFGSVCTITLAGSPQTQLKPTSCGITLNNLTDQIFCIPVSGATDYEYHIENSFIGYDKYVTRNSVNTDFRLSWISSNTVMGLRFATTYNISVRAKVGGVWLNFGPMCQVTTPAHPMTKLQNAYCTYTLPTFQTTLYSDAVLGVTNYRYHITGLNGYDRIVERNAPSNDFKFTWSMKCCGQQNVLPNTTYQVEVATYAGGVWSDYGTPCDVTIGNSISRMAATNMNDVSELTPEMSAMSVNVYPNPAVAGQVFTINVNGFDDETSSVYQINLYDAIGKVVYTSTNKANASGELILTPDLQLAAGVYFIEVKNNAISLREKLVVE